MGVRRVRRRPPRHSLALLTDADRPRRVVVARRRAAGRPVAGEDDDPTLVEVDEVVPLRLVAAVLADTEDAEADVAAGVRGGRRRRTARLADRCLDHELAWWATQEIGDLLDQTGA